MCTFRIKLKVQEHLFKIGKTKIWLFNLGIWAFKLADNFICSSRYQHYK